MNLVDNAIENSSENIISIDLIYDKYLIIKVSNYAQRDPKSRKFLSHKGNDHGLGLKIIDDIVDKYHGETYSTYQHFLYSKYIILRAGKTNDEKMDL